MPNRFWRSPRTVVGVAASMLVTFSAAIGLYLFGVLHWHLPLPRHLFRFDLVRAYLFDPGLRQLVDFLARETPHYAGQDAFATVWDTSQGVVLSRKLYRPVTMFGEPKFMYRPHLRKLSFFAGASGVYRKFAAEDGPEVRSLLAGLDVRRHSLATYDANGFRHVGPGLDSGCDQRVLFLGDSFTDGLWVGDAETFVSAYGTLVGPRAGIHVCPINAGIDGYGPLEEAYLLETYFDQLGRPPTVVLQTFPNDIDADYTAVMTGELAGADDKWQRALFWVTRMVDFCRANGCSLVVMAMPASAQRSQPETIRHYQDRLRAFAERQHVQFVDPLEALGDEDAFWSWDPHLTPKGHQAVAAALVQATAARLIPQLTAR